MSLNVDAIITHGFVVFFIVIVVVAVAVTNITDPCSPVVPLYFVSFPLRISDIVVALNEHNLTFCRQQLTFMQKLDFS